MQQNQRKYLWFYCMDFYFFVAGTVFLLLLKTLRLQYSQLQSDSGSLLKVFPFLRFTTALDCFLVMRSSYRGLIN